MPTIKYAKVPYIVFALMMAFVLLSISCVQKQEQTTINYDPAKDYAAFLVLNTDTGKASLESMKQHSRDEKYEIGPITYYDANKNADFVSLLNGLTVSKQVKLVWIISSVWDISNIKKSMQNVPYNGAYRYAPISDQGPIKIDQ